MSLFDELYVKILNEVISTEYVTTEIENFLNKNPGILGSVSIEQFKEMLEREYRSYMPHGQHPETTGWQNVKSAILDVKYKTKVPLIKNVLTAYINTKTK